LVKAGFFACGGAFSWRNFGKTRQRENAGAKKGRTGLPFVASSRDYLAGAEASAEADAGAAFLAFLAFLALGAGVDASADAAGADAMAEAEAEAGGAAAKAEAANREATRAAMILDILSSLGS